MSVEDRLASLASSLTTLRQLLGDDAAAGAPSSGTAAPASRPATGGATRDKDNDDDDGAAAAAGGGASAGASKGADDRGALTSSGERAGTESHLQNLGAVLRSRVSQFNLAFAPAAAPEGQVLVAPPSADCVPFADMLEEVTTALCASLVGLCGEGREPHREVPSLDSLLAEEEEASADGAAAGVGEGGVYHTSRALREELRGMGSRTLTVVERLVRETQGQYGSTARVSPALVGRVWAECDSLEKLRLSNAAAVRRFATTSVLPLVRDATKELSDALESAPAESADSLDDLDGGGGGSGAGLGDSFDDFADFDDMDMLSPCSRRAAPSVITLFKLAFMTMKQTADATRAVDGADLATAGSTAAGTNLGTRTDAARVDRVHGFLSLVQQRVDDVAAALYDFDDEDDDDELATLRRAVAGLTAATRAAADAADHLAASAMASPPDAAAAAEADPSSADGTAGLDDKLRVVRTMVATLRTKLEAAEADFDKACPAR